MDYSQLSDFEINKRIAETVYSIEVVADDFYAKDVPFAYHRDEQVFIFIDEPLSGAWRSYNPCHNPADAWPIIVNNQISLMYEEAIGKWCAGKPYWVDGCEWQLDIDVMEANPLRAAMVFFLMMKGAKDA